MKSIRSSLLTIAGLFTAILFLRIYFWPDRVEYIEYIIPTIFIAYTLREEWHFYQYAKIIRGCASILNVNKGYYLLQEAERRQKNRFDSCLLPSLDKESEDRIATQRWRPSRELVQDAREVQSRIQDLTTRAETAFVPRETKDEIRSCLTYGNFKKAENILIEAKVTSALHHKDLKNRIN